MADPQRPWMKFYTETWLSDPQLRLCTRSQRGLMIDLMSYAHSGTPYGYLTNGGKALTTDDLNDLLGGDVTKDLQGLLNRERVHFDETAGAYFIRRMVKDHARDIAFTKHGKKGGNPKLKRSGDEKARRDDSIHSAVDVMWKRIVQLHRDPEKVAIDQKLTDIKAHLLNCTDERAVDEAQEIIDYRLQVGYGLKKKTSA